MKGWNKSGQFYLLAAILIVAVIIGYVSINNYSKNKSPVRVDDLGKELGIETGQVLEYGVFHENEIEGVISNFTNSFYLYSSPDETKNFYFIHGTKDDLTIYSSEDQSAGTIIIGNSQTRIKEQHIQPLDDDEFCESQTGSNKIRCNFFGSEYEFEINPGDNFYFLISQEIGGEQYVTKG